MADSMLRVITTEDDKNQIFDVVKVQWVAGGVAAVGGLVAYVALACWTVIISRHALDYTSFGTGFAAILAGYATFMAGSGIALNQKAKSGG